MIRTNSTATRCCPSTRESAGVGRRGLRLRLDEDTPAQTGTVSVIETFGASAPIKQLLKKFGFSAENIVAAAKTRLRGMPAIGEGAHEE